MGQDPPPVSSSEFWGVFFREQDQVEEGTKAASEISLDVDFSHVSGRPLIPWNYLQE